MNFRVICLKRFLWLFRSAISRAIGVMMKIFKFKKEMTSDFQPFPENGILMRHLNSLLLKL